MKSPTKNPIRIDMTPMVDMGFLLLMAFTMIHFFQKPQAMELKLPYRGGCGEQYPIHCKESKLFTLNLAENNKLYFYRGIKDVKIDSIDFSNPANLRPVLNDVKQKIKNKWGSDSAMFVTIRPMASCNYKNVVDALDEMSINNVRHFSIERFDERDSIRLHKGRQPDAGLTSDLEMYESF